MSGVDPRSRPIFGRSAVQILFGRAGPERSPAGLNSPNEVTASAPAIFGLQSGVDAKGSTAPHLAEAVSPLIASERSHFRTELRAAREACARDAEAFDEILFAVERLGCRLLGKFGDLGKYEQTLTQLASGSAVPIVVHGSDVAPSVSFTQLFKAIREARNDALHQGAVARHLTARAVELAVILEDALVGGLDEVQHFMVKNPVTAEAWQTVAAIRQLMLANAFSYIPISWQGEWHLLSDFELATFLRRSEDRRAAMAQMLSAALAGAQALDLLPAPKCLPQAAVRDVIQQMDGGVPVLVVTAEPGHLLGIVSPADIL